MADTTLYRIPPGTEPDSFTGQFLDTVKKDPFGTVLIVPTSRLAREIRNRLADAGESFIPHSITTIQGCAEQLFSTHASDKTLISETEANVILSHILSDNSGEIPLISGRKGSHARNVDELRTFISVLIQRRTDYPACLGNLRSEKSSQIKQLFDAYLSYLNTHRLVDRDTLLTWAEDRLNSTGTGDIRTVYCYGLFEPSPAEKALITAMKNAAETMHYAIPFTTDEKIFTDDGSWLSPDTIITPPAGNRSTKPGHIRISGCKNTEDEIRVIAEECRNLIESGVPPGEIAVAFTDLAGSAPLVNAILPDSGIPYSSSAGIPIAQSTLIQSAFAIPAVPAFNYRREDVVNLLSSPHISYRREYNGEERTLDSRAVDILSRETAITDGAGTWIKQLGYLISRHSEKPGDETIPEHVRRKIRTAEYVLDGIEHLFSELKILEGSKTITGHIASFRTLIDRFGLLRLQDEGDPEIIRSDAEDSTILLSLLDTLEQTARFIPEKKISTAEFYSLLSQAATGKRKELPRNRNAVQVTGIRELAYLSYRHLFIAGMTEDKMPQTATPLTFANEREVAAMGTLSKRDILRTERYHFQSAILAGKEGVYISYAETAENKTLLSSDFVEELRKTVQADGWGSTSFPHSGRAAQIRAGKELAAGKYPAGVSDLHAVANRINIENYHRRGGYNSVYDGLLSGEDKIRALLLKLEGPKKVHSPTALETYAVCPFRYLLKYVLHLEPIPEPEPELSPADRGSLLHEILFRYFSGLEEGATQMTAAGHSEALAQLLSTAKTAMEPYERDDPVWEVYREKMLGEQIKAQGILEKFLRQEEEHEDSPFTPAYFEYSFGLSGRKKRSDKQSVRQPAPLRPDGEEILIRGSIDRIDTTEDRQFMVTDYKTGSHPTMKEITDGYALQLPLYIRAFEDITGMDGVAGSYYPVNEKEVINKVLIRDNHETNLFDGYKKGKMKKDDDFREIIDRSVEYAAGYIDAIREGRFTPAMTAGKCPSYCEYSRLCRFSELRLFEAEEEVEENGTD